MLKLSNRIQIGDTIRNANKEAILAGWVYRKRDHGKVSFIDLRDGSGLLQLVVTKNTRIIGRKELNIGLESVILVRGKIKKRPLKLVNPEIPTGALEMEVAELEVLVGNEQALPLDISKDIGKVHLDTLLNYRPLTLRSPKEQSIFKFSEKIEEGYREFMKKEGFTEIHTPKIIPTATEGGANVFRVDYFGKDVFLAQSPQFYKQMMVGVFEKVFEIGPVFRAEPHYTSRHINEFTGLDAEMGFIGDYSDIMAKLEDCIRFIMDKVGKEASNVKKIINYREPKIPKSGIPKITLKEGVKIINKIRKSKDVALDLDPEGERILGEYTLDKLKSDFIFVTEYPTSARPFYQMPTEEGKFTRSFDILFRGLELGTGAQRIHDPKKLAESMKKHQLNPKDFKDYISLFKFGMPPHGGWGLGLERFTKQWLGLDNVRLASLFPRDVKRVRP
ncbi:MAG: aspartate--tRNA(Asn) ligase [Candidatus Moranbacteria bacterium]|nr:aspartate--tRNA(Asn) ligase [Candidatus Moranbacteria bacterium]